MVLNEINNLKVDGAPIDIEVKQALYQDLFIDQNKTITKKTISKWLQANNLVDKDTQPLITGIDDTVKAKMTSLHDMKAIFGDDLPPRQVLDEIIRYKTLFPDEGTMFEEIVAEKFGQFVSSDQVKALKAKVYIGWGRLSEKLLEGLTDHNYFKKPTSIIQALYQTNHNLMEVLSEKFDYTRLIEEENKDQVDSAKELSYELLEELYVSPSVKRAIWQSLRIVDEIVEVTGHQPTKIFVEMARGSDQSGRTQSRKQQLLALYKNIKADRDLLEGLTDKLEDTEESQLRSKKLYLYYTQLGRCMYTGNPISLSQLMDNNSYNIDHIYPRSKTKDDSVANTVLVERNANDAKGDSYPISAKLTISPQTKQLWKILRTSGLISEKKYARLIRNQALDDKELSVFIERQLVETRQSTKAVASMLRDLYPDSQVVFTKARQANELRQHLVNSLNDRSFFKVRIMNDFHHAKDAYLNIVAGNVYHTKFTSNPANFFKGDKKPSYNLAKMYDYDVERNGRLAWRSGQEGTIKKVAKTLKQNNILKTWLQTDRSGALFDQTLMKKGLGQVQIKKGMDINKYGGYNKPSIAHYAIVDHDKKKKRERWLVAIPVHIKNRLKDKDDLVRYLEEDHDPQLKNVEIVVDHIFAANQLINVDNRLGRITGKSGTKYTIKNEIEPTFDDKYIVLIKELEKQENITNYTSSVISHEYLDDLYEAFTNLVSSPLYCNMLSNFITTLVEGKDIFLGLSIDDKISVLTEILELFKSNRELSDLHLIGGSKQSGVLTIGRNLTKVNSFKIINQSITGLFENEIEVMDLWPGGPLCLRVV